MRVKNFSHSKSLPLFHQNFAPFPPKVYPFFALLSRKKPCFLFTGSSSPGTSPRIFERVATSGKPSFSRAVKFPQHFAFFAVLGVFAARVMMKKVTRTRAFISCVCRALVISPKREITYWEYFVYWGGCTMSQKPFLRISKGGGVPYESGTGLYV